MDKHEQRVVVALSGGVDSSIAAALLLEQGYQVLGATLRFSPEEAQHSSNDEDRACCSLDGVGAAGAVARALGIPHEVVDCTEKFAAEVLRPAWDEYARGRTPNPCVHCNAQLKFSVLGEHARRSGARWLATGHHACLEPDGDGVALMRGRDLGKDQSYFLFCLSPTQLCSTLLPVGTLQKTEVRARARQLGLPNAERAESQDACFGSSGVDFAEALRQRFAGVARPGAIVDEQGRVLGHHSGIHHFTVGQRRGLGVPAGQRAYVLALDAARHEVIVSTDPRALEAEQMRVTDLHWLAAARPQEVEVQIRYRHAPVRARIEFCADGALVHFAQPQRAVTPGQAAVFYQGRRLLGGGWIAGPACEG